MQPLVSIIIPCFNHGKFIKETLQSIEDSSTTYDYEVIIVNDGSSDKYTQEILVSLSKNGYNIINQTNQGLAAARNNGISMAKGKYILPLDSDNKIHNNYLTKAIDILENSLSVDIVYGNSYFFGEEEGVVYVGEFNFTRIIQGNYIDACGIYRKKVWEVVNGYDGNMPAMGHEDWEFWIHAFLKGCKFYYLNEICFYYRSLPNSMSKVSSTPSENFNREYIHKKHSSEIVRELSGIIKNLIDEKNQLTNSLNFIGENKLKTLIKILLGYKFY